MNTEKIDLHYHQQLSALMDGELAADQGRFLIRRLQHDSELASCWDRWQLYGEVLRGDAQAPAPAGFAEGIARIIAAEPAAAMGVRSLRAKVARWGGGALAASVAAVALFMGRQQAPQDAPAVPSEAVANQAPSPVPRPEPSVVQEGAGSLEATAALAATGAAVASAPLRSPGTAAPGGSATRTQQARRVASVGRAPDRAVASAAVPVVHAIATVPADNGRIDPFSNVQVEPPSARPWPRAVLPQYGPAGGGFNADFSSSGGARDFHPFEPRLPPASPPQSPPAE